MCMHQVDTAQYHNLSGTTPVIISAKCFIAGERMYRHLNTERNTIHNDQGMHCPTAQPRNAQV